MRRALSIIVFELILAGAAYSQDLSPRAYVITPVRSNALVFGFTYYQGTMLFNDVVPITDLKAKIGVPNLSYYHSFHLFGRSANFTGTLPYGVATFNGKVFEKNSSTYRSGLADTSLRFSLNLHGGPAMTVQEFRNWKQKLIIGASLKITIPTGQYDSTKLINVGNNRWGFKPEIGVSRRWGRWIVDGYSGVWFYTTNSKFFSQNQYVSGITRQTQNPIFVFEGHLSYDIKPRLWASFDGNYWRGGVTSLNGVENPATLLSNSRIGGTASVPLTRHQSIKFGYNYGAYIRFGGNYQNVTAAWQYSWLGVPFKR